jgi:hypothetical protein
VFDQYETYTLEVLPIEEFTPAIRSTYNTAYEPELVRYAPKRSAYSASSGKPLSASQGAELRELLLPYMTNSVVSKAIGTAMRRFRISYERYSPNDVERLLDIAMALESLYLADIDRPHQELSYRLTSRVAWFLGQSLARIIHKIAVSLCKPLF